MTVVEMPKKEPSMIEQAEELIQFLNEKTGKRYPVRNPAGRPTANADVIMQRLKEKYTVADCKAVIVRKCRDWLDDDKMNQYLTPQTLFRRSNFERYIGECV